MLFSVLLQLLPFYFPNLSIGSTSCRNLSPSGWQPPQVPALVCVWGCLAAVKRAEGWRDSGSSLTAHGNVHFSTPSHFPELIHRCYYLRKNWSALANSKVFLFCPNYCVASHAEIGFSSFQSLKQREKGSVSTQHSKWL